MGVLLVVSVIIAGVAQTRIGDQIVERMKSLIDDIAGGRTAPTSQGPTWAWVFRPMPDLGPRTLAGGAARPNFGHAVGRVYLLRSPLAQADGRRVRRRAARRVGDHPAVAATISAMTSHKLSDLVRDISSGDSGEVAFSPCRCWLSAGCCCSRRPPRVRTTDTA
jgi:hypothetical protein